MNTTFLATYFSGKSTLGHSLLSKAMLLMGMAFMSQAATAQSLNKSFSPPTIAVDGQSTLTLIIDNSANAVVAEDVALVDLFPTGLSLSARPNLTVEQCLIQPSGAVTAPANGNTVTINDVSVGAGSRCTVKVNVTSSTIGVLTNTTGDLTSSLGNMGTASANLTVENDRPTFTQSFAPSSVSVGDRSRLTFTIDNSTNAAQAAVMRFTNTFPAGIQIASPSNVSNTCADGVFTGGRIDAVPGGNSVGFASTFGLDVPAVAAGGSCAVAVDVVATQAGQLLNVTSDFTSGNFPQTFITNSSGFSSATLTSSVTALSITQAFINDPVAPGGTAELEFTLTNVDRSFAATNVAFSNDLTTTAPALSGLAQSSVLMNTCGGSATGPSATNIGLSGTTLASGASCTIRFALDVPAGATAGNYANTSGAITAIIDGRNVTGNTASDSLTIEPSPVLTMAFLDATTFAPNPIVAAGGDVVLRYTINNTSTTSVAADIAFNDELTAGFLDKGFLPSPLSLVLPSVTQCGAGANITQTTFNTDRLGIAFNGGSLAVAPGAGSTCTFDVLLTIPNGFNVGAFSSTTDPITATVDGATRQGGTSTSTLSIIAAPTLQAVFINSPVVPGGTANLEFTLNYPEAAIADATGVGFSLDLTTGTPSFAGFDVANLVVSGACDPDGASGPLTGSGTLSVTNVDSLISLAGATLSPGQVCTVTVPVNVPVAAMGAYTVSSTVATASVGGVSVVSPNATAGFEVGNVLFSTDFLTNPVIPGESFTLRYSMENLAASTASAIGFSNSLVPVAGLVATNPVLADGCGGSMIFTATASGIFLSYSGGTLASGQTCQTDVEVTVPMSASERSYPNSTSSLTFTLNGSSSNSPAANSELTVQSTDRLSLNKSFTSNPVLAGDTARLVYEISNPDTSKTFTSIGFSEDFSRVIPGLTFSNLDSATDCMATTSATGSTLFMLSGLTLAAGESCTVVIDLTVPAATTAGVYNSTSSVLTGSFNAATVSGQAAISNLQVVTFDVDFTKAFGMGVVRPGGSTTLEFTITNNDATPLQRLSFTDDLSVVIPGLVATALPQVGVCGAGSSLIGSSQIILVNGNIPANDSCTFSVTVSVPASSSVGTFASTTSALSENALNVGSSAAANLIISPLLPTFSQEFVPDAIGLNGESVLTFTIDNSSGATALTGLSFSNTFPAGITLVSPGVSGSTCSGGTISATPGASTFTFAGGTVAANTVCSVNARVTSMTPGTYSNTTSDLTTSAGNSGSSTAVLRVLGATFSKQFDDAGSVKAGDSVALSFTITNNSSTDALTNLSFTDDINAVVYALASTDLPKSNVCGSGSSFTSSTVSVVQTTHLKSVANGASALSQLQLSGGSLAAGASCTFSVQLAVPANTAPGTFTNTTSVLLSNSITVAQPAVDQLTITATAPLFSKSFTPNNVQINEVSRLTFIIDNTRSPVAATSLAFADGFPSGLAVATPANVVNTCGGSVTAISGSGSVILAGGTLGVSGTCSISVNVISAASGAYVSRSGNLTSVLGNSGSASATLVVIDDRDRDGDGIPNDADNCPFNANADQTDLDADGQGNVCDNDDDGDGMPDQYEIDNGLDPLNSFDQRADPDGDGFTNIEEFRFGTNPNVANADDDNNGIPDVVDQRRMRVIVPNILLPLLLDDVPD